MEDMCQSHAKESSNNMQILWGHAGHAKVSNLINYFYFYLPLTTELYADSCKALFKTNLP